MLALAQSKQCIEEVLDKIWLDAQKVTKVAHEKIRQTLVLTLASLINKSTNIELKSKVIKWIVGSMLNCKKPECHQHFLRALKSIHSVSTIPICCFYINGELFAVLSVSQARERRSHIYHQIRRLLRDTQ